MQKLRYTDSVNSLTYRYEMTEMEFEPRQSCSRVGACIVKIYWGERGRHSSINVFFRITELNIIRKKVAAFVRTGVFGFRSFSTICFFKLWITWIKTKF